MLEKYRLVSLEHFNTHKEREHEHEEVKLISMDKFSKTKEGNLNPMVVKLKSFFFA